MQTEPGHNIPDDEIDIRSVGEKIFSFFSYPLSLLAANIKTTCAFVLVAILLSVAVKYTFPKTYRSSFIIRPTDIKDKLHLRVLSDLPVLLKRVNHDILATALGIDTVQADRIVNISFTNSSSGKVLLDSLNCTEITIETTDYNLFTPIQNGIMSYLEKNAYFAKIKTLQDHAIDMLLVQVEKDIVQLDSLKLLQLKKYEHQATSGQTSVMLNELIDPTPAYVLGLERVTKKTGLLAQRGFSEQFQLIKGCVVTKQPAFPPRILTVCFYLIPLFLLLCFIFLALKARMKP